MLFFQPLSLRFAFVAVALAGAFFGAAGACLSPAFGPAALICPAGLALLAALAVANVSKENIAGAAKRLEARLRAGGFAPADPGEVPAEVRPLVEAFNLAVARAAEMKESLTRVSATDSMTGLYNHREFHRRLGEMVSRGEKVAVACFDLNDLKQVNDRHGHQAGDEVILLFASVLQDAASRVPGAVPARLGGDEFAVLLPGFDYEAAERFSKSVARDPRLEEGSARYCPGGRVTVGRGAAAYPGDVEDAGLLLSRADERMYAHKSNGRSFSAKLSSVLARLDGETTLDEAEAVFEALLGLIDGLDRGLASHSRRVAKLAREVAVRMGLPPQEVRLAGIAGKFHDIGKLSVGPSVLRKKEPLTEEERKLIERHPVLGADMLSAVAAMREVAVAVKHHHERWDGTGYPDGLRGEEIPVLARIVAACEVYDAMTRAEFPRKGYAPEAALEEMRKSGGFDPRVVDALSGVIGR
ncbi:diguanylate cyclase (GGDEF)-like protein/putative nucleotidyltransferase with HDIG domain [Thermodesulfitimonas autotrophica]|uniref:Diguanylate cyclase (GGDEF)-like protein/putative nucleotidyltransferase with HDIG domain n=1 Tax=Thermodesulfitimonas autotrophica TaxID=1894989 RepID=A0A3N5AX29_9THEO|nr:diguanylate cyclase [Thermodesulfitimonas autotrophica]RPF49544.1 diguanylate cyclase (GGDEF)-like protein/putative nucleotidyltransferase with HDIG domain [Thermodesulfitimonas autotrophica]